MPSNRSPRSALGTSPRACNPECEDVQFAIHVPGTDIDGRSYSAVYRIADGSEVYGAKSLLIRDREGVRVITDTKLDPYY